MDNSDNPRGSRWDALLEVSAEAYKLDYGTPPEEDKTKTSDEDKRDARIFGDAVPRKKRSQPSEESEQGSSQLQNRVIEEQRSSSELQRPNTASEPASSSSYVTVKSSSSSKKRRPVKEEERRSSKKLKIVQPTQTASPPEWLVNLMRREENACDPKLIIQKQLSKNDQDKDRSSLSFPYNQVVNRSFLTEEETRMIIDKQATKKTRKKGVKVGLVDPMLKKHDVDLSGNGQYFILGGWNHVVAANEFEVDDVFDLWSFRSGSGKLCFALGPSPAINSSHVGGSNAGETGHGKILPLFHTIPGT